MRIGNNPNKDQLVEKTGFTHQVIMPVYIPNQKDYFKDSLSILKLSLDSLFKTTHNKTFISIVNNGSCQVVMDYLNHLKDEDKIHELIHTKNIGKLNAILKGLAGNNIELVTITDADVLFKNHWQLETAKVFKTYPKVGVVGIVPQFNMFKSYCGNIIFDNFFSKKLKFLPIKSPEALALFYKSIDWDDNYNKDFLKYGLGLEHKDINVLLGAGHFVATYKKQQFTSMKSYLGYILGGDSETYLDKIPLDFDYWRVTTEQNYAFHMGNVKEDWMSKLNTEEINKDLVISGFSERQKMNRLSYFLKNKLFYKLILSKRISRILYRYKGLPKEIVKNFNKIVVKCKHQ